ncbi:MAG: hypothetical protein H0W73_18190 [Bacteroidetes bacterium]|nr:hypothetical protein [Bacteroidota bacterium]
MKKIYVLLFLVFAWAISKSQITNIQFENIKQLIKEGDPKANIDDKLIMVSFWTPANSESRDLNKEIKRVEGIYKTSKLKGGKNGIYFFNYCISDDVMNYKMAVKRDSLDSKASFFQNEESKAIVNSIDPNKTIQTILFTSAGEVVEMNTKKENVFKLILKQITR